MNYLAKLDNDTIDAAIKGLWENSNILVGIGELLQSTNDDPCLGEEAMFGLGQLISRVGKSVRDIKENLEYGPESAEEAGDDEGHAEPEDTENTTKQPEKTYAFSKTKPFKKKFSCAN